MPDAAGLGFAWKVAKDSVPDKGKGEGGPPEGEHPGFDPESGTCKLHPEGCEQAEGGDPSVGQGNQSAWQDTRSQQGGLRGWGRF